MPAPSDLLERLRAGGKPALARALASIEAARLTAATLDLLDASWAAHGGRIIGLTGPPGVGKSSLAASLVIAWRDAGRTVGVVAIDPSSRRRGGALLGDRTRIDLDPEDQGVFVRSMAARSRLGGLADATFAAAVLMRALYDLVLIETVGVGQSETEIADLADTVVLAVQPGSGDILQYMKAGIVEVPDLLVVTKADLGPLAERTRLDLQAGMRLRTADAGGRHVPVVSLSAATGEGVGRLIDAVDEHGAWLAGEERHDRRRAAGAARWLELAVREEVGRRGYAKVAAGLADDAVSPFRRLAAASAGFAG